MNYFVREIIRRSARPLAPIATGERPVSAALHGTKAVLFDIYGTLFASSSGEIGTAGETVETAAFRGALEAIGVSLSGDAESGAQCLHEAIAAGHAESRKRGVEFPEVDIVAIWEAVCHQLAERGTISTHGRSIEPRRLAVEYEMRVNPVWPMPGLLECLNGLRERGTLLGIVSNAQFYTRELFPALLGRTVEALGFAPDLQFYSYRFGEAKPGVALFRHAAEALAARGVAPAEVLYLGNDVLNDVRPAAAAGFRTALFAGDRRSLRRREGDPRVEGVTPDSVVTDLRQVVPWIEATEVTRGS